MGLLLRKGANFNGAKATGLADGTSATDAVTLQQLQAMVRGLNWKEEVQVKSTANVNLAAPGASLNGYTFVTSGVDRFLVNNQTTGAENGIYIWNGAAAAATRAPDADTAAELINATVFVTQGTVNPDTMWVMTTDNITLGTTTPVFAQFGGGAAYTAGASGGLTLSSNAFSILLDTASGLVLGAGGIKVDTTVVARIYQQDCAATTNPQTFAHGLGKRPHAQVVLMSTGEVIYCDVTVDTTNIVVDYGAAPSAAEYRVIGIG